MTFGMKKAIGNFMNMRTAMQKTQYMRPLIRYDVKGEYEMFTEKLLRLDYGSYLMSKYEELKSNILQRYNVDFIEKDEQISIVLKEDRRINWITLKMRKSREYVLEMCVFFDFGEKDKVTLHNYKIDIFDLLCSLGNDSYGFDFSTPIGGTYFHLLFKDFGFLKLAIDSAWFEMFLNITYETFTSKIEHINKICDDENIDNIELSETEKEMAVLVRLKQGEFKKKLVQNSIEVKCNLCDIKIERILIGSHIKPWSKSKATPGERIDPNNGFLLCPNHDALFDKKLISFNSDGTILISESISQEQYKILNISPKTKILLTDKNKEYLEWHRNQFLEQEDYPIFEDFKKAREL
jgi:hypothetical protein